MSSTNLLRNYLPDISQLSVNQLVAIRSRLVDDLANAWPQLDTRPNSVAGDLNVTPTATLIAKAEAAVAMIMSDFDLTNVADGTVYNPTFVTALLNNLGVSATNGTYASGVAALTFSVNKNYVIPINTVFTFNGNSNFTINPGSGNPVVIYAYDPSNPSSTSHQWVLHQTDINSFTVYLPVLGNAGSVVSDGTSATSTLTTSELTSIQAVGDFDSGALPETLPQMAARAQKAYASPNMMTRSGALSFLASKWTQLNSSYVSITGDGEMLRAGTNPLGIVDGAMDVFIKSKPQFTTGMANIPLVYDSTQGGWVGALSLPTFPSFYAMNTGIFQTANFQNKQSATKLYSKSLHPTTDSLAISFSKWEQLGIFITDAQPTNFQPASTSPVTSTGSKGISLNVSGEYASSVFNSTTGRSVQIQTVAVTTWGTVNNVAVPAVQATILDTNTGDSGILYFVPNSATSATGGILATDSPGYEQFLNGLNMSISSPAGTFVPADFVGSRFAFNFVGRTAYFTVNYLYDALIPQVDSVLQNPDNKPIGVDVVTRSLMPCYISRFDVNYRVGYGKSFDAASAQNDIYNYLNSLSGPDVYEEAEIGKIVQQYGASGLISVTKAGTFFPSLANVFVDENGTETTVPRYNTNTLQIPPNVNGISANTATYLVNLGTITLNATIQ